MKRPHSLKSRILGVARVLLARSRWDGGRRELDGSRSGEALIESKSHRIRGVYMHIHKCAGTSLIDALETVPEVICCVARPGNFDRRTGRERIPDDIWSRSIKFTFVRHPYDRLYSAYNMFAKSPKWRGVFPTFRDLVEFLSWCDVRGHQVATETDTASFVQSIGNIIHHCSAYDNPKYRIEEMDVVGRVEFLDRDYLRVAEELGCELPPVPRLRTGGMSGSYRERLSEWERDAIFTIYRADFEAYGYER